jgi:hypothetical protein
MIGRLSELTVVYGERYNLKPLDFQRGAYVNIVHANYLIACAYVFR